MCSFRVKYYIKTNTIRMKKLFILAVILMMSLFGFSQDYTVDFSDTSTYDVTCGKVIPSQWSVKNDSCLLYTPYFLMDTYGSPITFYFRINQSGNGDGDDNGYVFHSIDNGPWMLDTAWIAGGQPQVYVMTDSVLLEYGHYIQFMCALQTNAKTEFWSIMGGDIEFYDSSATQTLFSIWQYPPPPPEMMPVDMIYFKGFVYDTDKIFLEWMVASETNCDYYIIQTAGSANGFYQPIKTVAGNGTMNEVKIYYAYDYLPINGVTYYKLLQVDYNGAVATYGPIAVNYVPEDMFSYSIYPNPINSNLLTVHIQSLNRAYQKVNVYITDCQMKIIYRTANLIDGNMDIMIDMNSFDNGIYMLTIKNGKGYSHKIIKY